MATKLKKAVGKGVKHQNDSDVLQVVELLNVHIANGKISRKTALPTSSKGTDADLIDAIEDFQDKVVKLSKPDGRVDPGGKTIKELRKAPKSFSEAASLMALAGRRMLEPAPGGISQELWRTGLWSLITHASNSNIKKNVIMLVDFRKSRNQKRLWIVDLEDRSVFLHTLVSHGKGYRKGVGGKANGKEVVTAAKFSNVTSSNDSSVGGYVVLGRTSSTAGSLAGKGVKPKKRGPAAIIDGLDTTNSKAKSRLIIIHGASYVSRSVAGNSQGCFATHPEDNAKIVNKMSNGGFIYAYAGESYRANEGKGAMPK